MTISEIKRIILSLKPKNSFELDGFPPKLLRVLPEQDLETLAYFFNQSSVTGKLLEAFKKAKMIPIYKKEILYSYNKILEKAVHSLSYLNCCKTLSKFWFGFHPNHSTSAACNCLVNKITKHFGNIKITLTIFLDLSKAYDVLEIIKFSLTNFITIVIAVYCMLGSQVTWQIGHNKSISMVNFPP